MDWIADQIFGGIQNFFSNIFIEMMADFGEVLSSIMGTTHVILDEPIVIQAMIYSQALAFMILGAKVAAEAIKTYILHSNGDPDADTQGLLLSTIKAVAVIASIPWGLRWFFQIGTAIARDVANLPVGIPIDNATFLNAFGSAVGGSFLIIFMAIIGAIFVIIICLQALVRAAYLGLLAVIGPVLAISIVGSDGHNDLFKTWSKEVVIVCFSQAIQIFMFMAAGHALGRSIGGGTGDFGIWGGLLGTLMFLAWLWATIRAPAVIKEITYSSGGASAAGRVGTMVLVRKITTKGV